MGIGGLSNAHLDLTEIYLESRKSHRSSAGSKAESMATEVATMEQSQLKSLGGAIQEKPLKTRKSLTRSLSSAFRKSSRSRPASSTSEKIYIPPTPQIPAQLFPLKPGLQNASQLPTPHVDVKPTRVNGAEQAGREGSTGFVGNAVGGDESQIMQRRSFRNLSPRHARQQSWIGGDDAQRPRTASANLQSNELTSKVDSIKLPKKSRSKTSLRITSGYTSAPPLRGTSMVVPKAKSSPAVPQLSRPATSGGRSPQSPVIVHQARHRGHSSPQTGSQKTSFDVYDLPPSPQRPWQASYNAMEVRSSFRSAVTVTSSRTNTTGTNRSSVVTKDTCITDVTTDPHSRPVSKAEECLTVDEAIDMYLAGFTDDPNEEPEESRESSVSDEERRRSRKIAEAIGDNMGSPSSARPSFGGSPTSARPSTSASSRSISHNTRIATPLASLPASSSPLTDSRDQYGFLKTNHHISRPIYDAWYADYLPTQERRTEKWTAYMREQGLSTDNPTKFPSRSTKTQRYIRKGIPPAWRGASWFHYAGGDAYLSRHPQLYNNLVHFTESKLGLYEKESIERDLHRTFPDNVRFKPDPVCAEVTETPLLTSLRRVLSAFALHNSKIGYCQSLNFIAALLLLFLPEEKAFWMLHIITMLYLPGTHEVSLEGANIDLWVLMVALKGTLPGVWAKVGAAGLTDEEGKKSKLPPISLCTTSWFMSLFIGTLPIETVLRVWDVLFYEGSRTLFRVALTIFKIGESRIKSVSDSMELFQVVQGLPRGMIDAGKFMECVCRKGQLGSDWVERRRGERRMWFAKERAKAAGVSVYEDAESEMPAPKEVLARKASVWRNRRLQELVG